ncbi:MAG: family 43 glycosylhydrolase [Myxococcales bacterium]|nr:family 43 glycosylhydrolase [Myxococcales bacterium]
MGAAPDARTAGPTDAGPTDATQTDAAPTDATLADATAPDATPTDAGPCQPRCAPHTCADDGCGQPCACPEGATCRDGRCGLAVTNPVLAGDHPDPDVLRVEGPDGPTYYLSHTVHDAGDLPLYRSRDLVHWERLPGAFDRPRTPGASMALNGAHFCALWAPDLAAIPGGYLLGFSAMRYRGPQAACPGYGEDGGVYQAWSPTPEGPYARADHPWEPVPAGANAATCGLRDQLPRSVDYVSHDCQGTFCHHVIRLDSETWQDPATGRWWLSYAWYTNVPPRVAWERDHLGEHVSLVELDAADPFAVRCAADTPQIFVADGHDAGLRAALAAACPRCGEQLAFDRGRQGEPLTHAGLPWTVVEGPALLRRGDYVYALMSGSAWDSAWYHVFWVAARTVEGLAQDAPDRLVGRLLIPSRGQAFGHGVPVLGPDGDQWFYVHHRLDAERCRATGDCRRDLWVSPIDFEDRGDGRGAVHLRARHPAEAPDVFIPL